jgi:D-3-phosphoglycerate dehydrogenase / 2-oxoglutarate reductase
MRVLATAPYFRPVPQKYADVFAGLGIEVDALPVDQNMAEKELLEIIHRYDGVIAGDDEFTAKVIELGAKHSLRVIAKWGVGINAIDLEAAKRHGVEVRRSPGALSDAVADQAWGYILMLARHLHESDSLVREGKWVKLVGLGLRGRTLGVIGVGNIGKQVALRAVPFGMKLLGTDVVPIDPAFLAQAQLRMVQKSELLAESDFVVLACDLNPSSHHIIGGLDLARMRPGAHVINVARGGLVDTKAIVAALQERRIAGGAFDVYEDEPLPLDHPLRSCPNVLLNAHNAFNADTAVQFVNDNTVRELLSVLRPDYAFKA